MAGWKDTQANRHSILLTKNEEKALCCTCLSKDSGQTDLKTEEGNPSVSKCAAKPCKTCVQSTWPCCLTTSLRFSLQAQESHSEEPWVKGETSRGHHGEWTRGPDCGHGQQYRDHQHNHSRCRHDHYCLLLGFGHLFQLRSSKQQQQRWWWLKRYCCIQYCHDN